LSPSVSAIPTVSLRSSPKSRLNGVDYRVHLDCLFWRVSLDFHLQLILLLVRSKLPSVCLLFVGVSEIMRLKTAFDFGVAVAVGIDFEVRDASNPLAYTANRAI